MFNLKAYGSRATKKIDVGRVIVVADKGLNTGNNIAYNKAIGNGYVMSLSIRKSNDEMKNFVLNEKDYVYSKEKTLKKKISLVSS